MSDNPKPPFVRFEVRAVEDRQRSLELGRYAARDIHMAIITPAGTKDMIEKEATAWLKDLEEAVQQERFPADWLDAYKRRYKNWLDDREDPAEGTSVRNWPGVSPAQVNTLLDIGLPTVEHVAEATEEAIARIGMGGRALKAKAQAYLDASKDSGKTALELEDLRVKVGQLLERDKEREAELQRLSAENAKLTELANKKG